MVKKNKIIVLRFSSLGDVAILVPVIKEFLIQNTNSEILVISRNVFLPLFSNIKNCNFIGIDFDHKHKGVIGLLKILFLIIKQNPTHIADLHQVLRTKFLLFFLSFTSIPISSLQKGRKERKKLIRKKNKLFRPMQPMYQRYTDVFRNLGFTLQFNLLNIKNSKQEINTIGIAPFAKYKEKMLLLQTSKKLAIELAEFGYKIKLFGGGKNEIQELQAWENEHSNINSLAGKMKVEDELIEISKLDVMISMDSANMHLASLVGVRVISVWGGTHPYAGFLGYNQSEKDCVQISLFCRPCSIFGNKTCYRNNWECMNSITTKMIIDKIKN